MATHKLMVLSNPTAGNEDAYNEWYNDVHLKEVCAVPGVVAAQRFKLGATAPGAAWSYVAFYELEGDDPMAVLAEVGKASPGFDMSAAYDASTQAVFVLSSVSDVVNG